MELSNTEKDKLEEHLKAIAKIIYQNTPADKLKTFEEIETTLREEIQEGIVPEIAQFFLEKLVKLKPEDPEK